MKRGVNTVAAIGIIIVAATLWKGRAQPSELADFSGEWQLVSASGATPPDGFVMQAKQSSTALHVAAHWTEPRNGAYGLTLTGLFAPESTFFLNGREDLNQAGPFVIHSRTRGNGARLITTWNTSEFQGSSFDGRWVRALSPGGREFTLEVQAHSSQGASSGAVLKFRRK